MKSRLYIVCQSILPGLVLLLLSGQAWAQAYSHVRMVRLSFVEGEVTVQRPDAQEWATAPVNLPVSEGFKLATGESGFTEVEFEDASTARLGQLSQLEFNQLMLSSDGHQINNLTLQQGYATFRSKGHSVQLFEVRAGEATLVAQGDALFRLDLQDGQLRVTVFKGVVQVTDPSYSGALASPEVLTILPGENPPSQISQEITKDAWDEWVAQRESQSTSLESRRNPGVYSDNTTSLLYGMTDLDFYGSWSYFPSYGYGWVPRVRSGWIPYSSGRWCWYPRFGYTWISAEPWGWLPYHYGDWAFDPSMGWFWLPRPASMGAWSPGRVNWYKGPGWIGWTPQAATHPHGHDPCPQGASCATVVSADAFQSGRFLNPQHRMSVDLSQGTRVGKLDVPPNPLLASPGLPVNWPAGGAPARQVHPSRGQFGVGQTGTTGVAATAGVIAPAPSGETIPVIRPQASGNPAQRAPSGTRGIAFDPVSGQFVNAPNPVPKAGMRKTSVTPERPAGNTGQLPAQVSPGGLGVVGVTNAGEPAAARGPFQDELVQPHSGSPLPAGAHSLPGSQPPGTASSSAPSNSPTMGSWGAPRSPDRSTIAPAASPRSTSSPSGSAGGTAPHPSPMRDMGSSGVGRGGGSFPSTSGRSSGPSVGSVPSSPGGSPSSGGRPSR
jgi:hypothetical protein